MSLGEFHSDWRQSVVSCSSSDKTWLSIEGVQTQCSIALQLAGDTARRQVLFPHSKGQAEHLPGMFDWLCQDASIAPEQIEKIAVCVGPGAFTGLRISVAYAQGLAFGLDKELTAVSSIAALSYGVFLKRQPSLLKHELAQGIPLLISYDARMGQVYAGGYTFWHHEDSLSVECWLPDLVISPDELMPLAQSRCQLLSSGVPLVLAGSGASLLSQQVAQVVQEEKLLVANDVLDLALAQTDLTPSFVAQECVPLYLRQVVAKPPERLQVSRNSGSTHPV